MATLSSVKMGSQATPSVRIPLGAVPRPGPAASPLPAPLGRPRGAGARSVRESERAGRRGPAPPRPAGGAHPAPRPRRAARPARLALRPPRGAPRPRNPASPGRTPREGEVAAAAKTAALTIAGRQALPGARVPMARTLRLDFTSIPFFPRAPLSWSSAPPSSPRLPWSPPSLVAADLFVFPVVVFFFVFVFSSSSSVFTKGTESVKTPARWAAGGFRRSAARTHNYKPVSIKQFHGPQRGWSAAP